MFISTSNIRYRQFRFTLFLMLFGFFQAHSLRLPEPLTHEELKTLVNEISKQAKEHDVFSSTGVEILQQKSASIT